MSKFMLVLLVLIVGCIFWDTSHATGVPFYKTDTFKKWTLQPTDETRNDKDFLGIPRHGWVTNSTYAFSVIGLTADWMTTIDSSQYWLENRQTPTGHYIYETNRWMGERPSRGKINRYFIGQLVINHIINVIDLTHKYKNVYNVVRGYVHYDASRGNVELGATYKW